MLQYSKGSSSSVQLLCSDLRRYAYLFTYQRSSSFINVLEQWFWELGNLFRAVKQFAYKI